MKLYNIPKESKIFCEATDGSTYIIFHHLDGKFSYCTTENGATVHLSASQLLNEVEGGYALKDPTPHTEEN